ncbi:hypothetical protein Tco_0821541 [Tanacetum coccineum]|uniref:Uncharacterized protein n=1 Tax=Tanacetum coccineum TaxID=301880 RepID=A0ABQ5AFP6_9ASTR
MEGNNDAEVRIKRNSNPRAKTSIQCKITAKPLAKLKLCMRHSRKLCLRQSHRLGLRHSRRLCPSAKLKATPSKYKTEYRKLRLSLKLFLRKSKMLSRPTVEKRDEKERQKPKQRNLAMPSIGRHLKVKEVPKKKIDEDEAKRLEDEEAAAKAKEEAADKSREEEDDSKDEEDAEDNVDVNQVFNKIQNMPFLNTSTKSKKKAAEKVFEEKAKEAKDKQKTNTNKRKIEEVEYEQPEKKKTNKKKMKCMKNYSRKTGRQQKINIQESDSEDNNTASEGENDDDVEIRIET